MQKTVIRLICAIFGIFLMVFKECLCTVWEKNLQLDQNKMTGHLVFSTTSNLPRCSMTCFRDKNCKLFSYDKTTYTCQGFSGFAVASDENAHPIKSEIYTIATGDVSNIKIIVHRKKKNYHDASAICVGNGGRLLSIDTEEKEMYMITNFTDPNEKFWVGLSDLKAEGKWIWDNGSPYVPTNKVEHQFNNYDSKKNRKNADCAILNLSALKYSDWLCSLLFEFLCEISLH